MIREVPVLPAGCVGALLDAPEWPAAPAFHEERLAIRHAVLRRQREFAAGRDCARVALRMLGVPPVAIGVGSHREPLWPGGVRGSISHCRRVAAAVVTRSDRYEGVGIDVEEISEVDCHTASSVLTPVEMAKLSVLGDAWPAVGFSAKESVYKAWFAATGDRLRFDDAVLHVSGGRVSARLRGSVWMPVQTVVHDGLVFTATTVGAHARHEGRA